jgi:PAS domain S-box-containing protein
MAGGGAGPSLRLTPEEKAWLAANPEKLTLWFDQDYPPIEFMSPDGSFAGLGADIMALLEKRLGVTFLKVPSRNWDRQLKALESGESAIAPVIVRTPERERYALFSSPYVAIPAVIITRRDHDDAASLDDLAGSRVAVVQGFVSEEYLRANYGGSLDIVTVKSVQDGLREVSVAGVDAMVENLAVAAYHIDAEKLPNLKVAGTTDLVYSQSFAVSSAYPLLYSAMQKAMADIPEQELRRIEQKWIHLEAQGPSREMLQVLWYGGLFAATLFACLSGMGWWLRRRLEEKQEALRETEARYRDIFENAPVAIFRATPAGRFVVINPTYAAMAGYPSPEAMIEGITDIATQMYDNPEDREVYKRLLAEHGSVRDFEARLRRRDGGIFWASMTSRTVRDAAGAIAYYDGFLTDVTERKRAEEALRQAHDTLEVQVAARTVALREANERLLELDRQRASFLSSASHELRTPLTSVLGFAKLAARTFSRHFLPLAAHDSALRGKSAIILENLSIIAQEGERLTRLINDLLDLNKIEAGRMEWRDACLNVAEEMHAAAKAMQGAFAAKPGVRFSLQLAEDAGMVVIDRDRLRQMILNLLSNAIKYTDMGTVRLYAGPTPDGGLRIAVADTGAGVAEDDRERVFQKFYQGSAQNPDDAKPAGTGLGLAICKNIVEHYGGEIRLESRVGHGSTFIVEFPSAIRPEKGGPAVFPPSHTP